MVKKATNTKHAISMRAGAYFFVMALSVLKQALPNGACFVLFGLFNGQRSNTGCFVRYLFYFFNNYLLHFGFFFLHFIFKASRALKPFFSH
jgi:hypothetical protein